MILVDCQYVQLMAGCLVISSYFGPDLVFAQSFVSVSCPLPMSLML